MLIIIIMHLFLGKRMHIYLVFTNLFRSRSQTKMHVHAYKCFKLLTWGVCVAFCVQSLSQRWTLPVQWRQTGQMWRYSHILGNPCQIYHLKKQDMTAYIKVRCIKYKLKYEKGSYIYIWETCDSPNQKFQKHNITAATNKHQSDRE